MKTKRAVLACLIALVTSLSAMTTMSSNENQKLVEVAGITKYYAGHTEGAESGTLYATSAAFGGLAVVTASQVTTGFVAGPAGAIAVASIAMMFGA